MKTFKNVCGWVIAIVAIIFVIEFVASFGHKPTIDVKDMTVPVPQKFETFPVVGQGNCYATDTTCS